MTTTINGTTGVSQIQDGTVTTAKIVDGTIATVDIGDAQITPAKLNGSQTGSAPVYAVRAWCQFDGTLTGTNAPAAGGNVASITRNSAGNYTVNFTTALPNTNFAVCMLSGSGTHVVHNSTRTTSSIVLLCHTPALAAVDSSDVSMIVLG